MKWLRADAEIRPNAENDELAVWVTILVIPEHYQMYSPKDIPAVLRDWGAAEPWGCKSVAECWRDTRPAQPGAEELSFCITPKDAAALDGDPEVVAGFRARCEMKLRDLFD